MSARGACCWPACLLTWFAAFLAALGGPPH
jgi:hypothetical protein